MNNSFGLRIFYKGLLPTAIRESLFTCGYLGLGPVIKGTNSFSLLLL